jgi:hypothetical protein
MVDVQEEFEEAPLEKLIILFERVQFWIEDPRIKELENSLLFEFNTSKPYGAFVAVIFIKLFE